MSSRRNAEGRVGRCFLLTLLELPPDSRNLGSSFKDARKRYQRFQPSCKHRGEICLQAVPHLPTDKGLLTVSWGVGWCNYARQAPASPLDGQTEGQHVQALCSSARGFQQTKVRAEMSKSQQCERTATVNLNALLMLYFQSSLRLALVPCWRL